MSYVKKSTQAAIEARELLEECVSKEEIDLAAAQAAKIVMAAGCESSIVNRFVQAAYMRIGANIANSETFKIPTPPVGAGVIWYEYGQPESDRGVPALVYAQLEPGVLHLIALKPSGVFAAARTTNVFWDQHHDIRSPTSDKRRGFGSWDYPAGSRIPKDDYNFQREVMERDKKIQDREKDRDEKRRLIERLAEEDKAAAVRNGPLAGDLSATPQKM